jgi:hypothetical protein
VREMDSCLIFVFDLKFFLMVTTGNTGAITALSPGKQIKKEIFINRK